MGLREVWDHPKDSTRLVLASSCSMEAHELVDQGSPTIPDNSQSWWLGRWMSGIPARDSRTFASTWGAWELHRRYDWRSSAWSGHSDANMVACQFWIWIPDLQIPILAGSRPGVGGSEEGMLTCLLFGDGGQSTPYIQKPLKITVFYFWLQMAVTKIKFIQIRNNYHFLETIFQIWIVTEFFRVKCVIWFEFEVSHNFSTHSKRFLNLNSNLCKNHLNSNFSEN